jgi:hypothetical protein
VAGVQLMGDPKCFGGLKFPFRVSISPLESCRTLINLLLMFSTPKNLKKNIKFKNPKTTPFLDFRSGVREIRNKINLPKIVAYSCSANCMHLGRTNFEQGHMI